MEVGFFFFVKSIGIFDYFYIGVGRNGEGDGSIGKVILEVCCSGSCSLLLKLIIVIECIEILFYIGIWGVRIKISGVIIYGGLIVDLKKDVVVDCWLGIELNGKFEE